MTATSTLVYAIRAPWYVGAATLGACYALLFLYLAGVYLVKRRRERRNDTVVAGAVRVAAARGDVAALQALEAAPAFSVEAALEGFTALHAAAVGGHRDAVLWLCERGANVHAIKRDGWNNTALHYAACRGSHSTAEVLLAYGADPAATNSFEVAPAYEARKRRHVGLAEYLEGVAAGKLPRPARSKLVPWCGYSAGVKPENPADLEIGLRADGTLTVQHGMRRAASAAQLAAVAAERDAAWRVAARRGWEGWGSEGTAPRQSAILSRILGASMQVLGVVYLAWRALRSFLPGAYLWYSVPIFICEFAFYACSHLFVLSLWSQVDRPPRWAGAMLAPAQLPHVDVFVVRYNEGVDVIEPAVIAALNMDWPGDKLTVHVLDDGCSAEVHRMVRRLRFQLGCMKREAKLCYASRGRRPGGPHHAKADNINRALLSAQRAGDYIVVLDCDMVLHPDFLQRALGHFYACDGAGGWRRKTRVGFLQTPQDFFNITPSDPMVHAARIFYGPMLQGRDGIGAATCCGTGVIFDRAALVSIGGQAYGSITEDLNTAMELAAAGFASMYLNERLAYGMAPNDIAEVLQQRLRWAMGAIQILMRTNPLCKAGLTIPQALLFYDSGSYHFLALPTIVMTLCPIIYIYTGVAPLTADHLWEFVSVFGGHFLVNRAFMWAICSGVAGGGLELWRGWQMWLWMAPNHMKAIWKVAATEVPALRRLLRSKEVAFKVTTKSATPGRRPRGQARCARR